ncbi:MAG: hypothetical protein ACRC5A_05030 [Enterobacteriaceae bacterium]
MKFLFRAFAYSTYTVPYEVYPIEETMIFFESERVNTAEYLRDLLSLIWSVPVEYIEITNLWNETELHLWASSEAVYNSPEWDLQLMEVGWGDNKPIYTKEYPLFLVPPRRQRRLIQIFHEGVSRMDGEGERNE